MYKKELALALVNCLEKEYPQAVCSLKYDKDYQLLFATRLAAQCTDERVNAQTPALFARYPSLEHIAQAEQTELEQYIRPCGFYHTKARDIIQCAAVLLEKHAGVVPDNMEELITLPGVGRKTANLILGDVYGKPSVVVDTHCIRLSNRMGLVDRLKDPAKIEQALRELLPPEKSSDFCHRLVIHGRAVCPARRPRCDSCCCADVCLKSI